VLVISALEADTKGEAMALDPQAEELRSLFEAQGVPPLEEMSVPFARQAVMAYTALQGEPEAVGEVRDILVPAPAGELPVRVYIPEAARGSALIIYFHGGGWVIGNLELVDRPCRSLANVAGCVVASVEYRLSPETKFPGPVDDAYAATAWLAGHASDLGADPAKVVVCGDSAGGNLAAVVAQLAKERSGPDIALQVLIYPATAGAQAPSFPSYDENGEGYLLTKAAMDWFWRNYMPDSASGTDPRAAPLQAPNLTGLPPALVIVAGYDPLRDEGLAYAQKLEEAGVKVDISRYDGQMHGFFWLQGALDAARSAMGDIAAAVSSVA